MRNRLLPLLLMVAAAVGCNGGAERQKEVEATLQRTLAAQARPPYVTTDAEGKKLWKLSNTRICSSFRSMTSGAGTAITISLLICCGSGFVPLIHAGAWLRRS